MDSLQIVRWCIFGVGVLGVILSIANPLFALVGITCGLTLNMLPLKRNNINPIETERHEFKQALPMASVQQIKDMQRQELVERRERIQRRLEAIKNIKNKPTEKRQFRFLED